MNHALKLLILCENVLNLLQQKVAQNVTISLGYFIFSKNHHGSLKVAILANNAQSGHPACLLWFYFYSCIAFVGTKYFIIDIL
jgi:hypothetical protein